MKNTIVRYEGLKNGEDFLEAQFCPQKEDVEKAVDKFLNNYMEKRPKEDTRSKKSLIEGIIKYKGFYVEQENGDCEQIAFEKL